MKKQYKIIVLAHSIKMVNPQQNEIHDEIEQFNKDINLLQYKLKN